MKNKRKVITTTLKGGLGNQMFQYAIARANQIENGFDLIQLLADRNNTTIKLLEFNNIRNHITLIEKDNYLESLLSRIDRYEFIFKNNKKLKTYVLRKLGIYIYDEGPIADIKKNDNYLYFNGYWQSEKYFEKQINTIKNDFTFNKKLPYDINIIIEKIKNCNSVCLHIRLGDYLKQNNEDKFNVCTVRYYEDSIKKIKSLVSNPVFYVFSDEIEKAKKLLPFLSKEDVYYSRKYESELIDLQLMSNCKHFIISNSTFSWWAQYLSNNYDKIVIASEKWLNGEDWEQIYQDSWIKVPVE